MLVRFAVFELDLDSGDLRRDGRKLRLQEQPFHVLRLLIQRKGDLVSREELRQALWGEATFVDFESGLNNAVARLRATLRDSSAAPRYIETVPRQGYRFICPVEEVKRNDDPPIRLRAWLAAAAAVAALLWIGAKIAPQRPAIPTPVNVNPLTSDPGRELYPDLSPSGAQVVYSATGQGGVADLYVLEIASGERQRLTASRFDDLEPRWSPDGEKIAFLRQEPGSTELELYLLPLALRRERLLLRFEAGHCTTFDWIARLDWSADSSSLILAFPAAPGEPCALHRIGLDGAVLERLTSPPPSATGDCCPAVAPGSDQIAFLRSKNIGEGRIYIVDGSRPERPERRLTEQSWWNERAVWLSDSALLARAAAPEDPLGLAVWLISAESGATTMLPGFQAGRLEQMAASLDGRSVVFADEVARASIFRVDLTSSPASPERVDRLSSTRSEGFPVASPDGSQVLFVSDRSGQVGLWLSQNGAEPRPAYANEEVYAGSPAWSPNGERLAFGANPDGSWDILLLDPETGESSALVSDPSDDICPSFAPDGESVYFGSDRSGRFEIWRMDVATGRSEQITRGGGYVAQPTPDGRRLLYTKVDAQELTELWSLDLSTGEEFLALPSVWHRTFFVHSSALYFLTQDADSSGEQRYWLGRAAFDGSNVERLAELGAGWRPQIGMSLDKRGEELLFSAIESPENDLMLVRLE